MYVVHAIGTIPSEMGDMSAAVAWAASANSLSGWCTVLVSVYGGYVVNGCSHHVLYMV